MAVKAIFQKDENPKGKKKTTRAKDSSMKPLAKVYLEQNPKAEGESFFCFQARVTPKGFLLLVCKDFSLLMPAGLEEASVLLDTIFPGLNGKKGNRLCITLSSSSRFGGYVSTDDEHQCFYHYDEENEILMTSSEPIRPKEEETKKPLSLADFGITT